MLRPLPPARCSRLPRPLWLVLDLEFVVRAAACFVGFFRPPRPGPVERVLPARPAAHPVRLRFGGSGCDGQLSGWAGSVLAPCCRMSTPFPYESRCVWFGGLPEFPVSTFDPCSERGRRLLCAVSGIGGVGGAPVCGFAGGRFHLLFWAGPGVTSCGRVSAPFLFGSVVSPVVRVSLWCWGSF